MKRKIVEIERNAKAINLTNLGVFTTSNPTSESFMVTAIYAGDLNDRHKATKKEANFTTDPAKNRGSGFL